MREQELAEFKLLSQTASHLQGNAHIGGTLQAHETGPFQHLQYSRPPCLLLGWPKWVFPWLI